MNNPLFLNFLLLQWAAHLLVDFYFQNDASVKQKKKKGWKSTAFRWHIVGVFVLSWLFSFQLNFVLFALLISGFHLLIDLIKNLLWQSKKTKRFAFYIDQFLHMASIVGVVILYFQITAPTPLVLFTMPTIYLSIPLAFLAAIKPANILIREIFYTFKIKIKFKNELPNAGKIIGALERIFMLTLIFTQQYAGVAFLIFAKSILRYKSDSKKAEYVLIGTMLSALIAIALCIIALALAGQFGYMIK